MLGPLNIVRSKFLVPFYSVDVFAFWLSILTYFMVKYVVQYSEHEVYASILRRILKSYSDTILGKLEYIGK